MKKSEIIRRLRELRRTYETEYAEEGWELCEKDVCILTDVCEALGLVEAETRYVVGEKYEVYVTGPIRYTLTGKGAFYVAFGLVPPEGAVEPIEVLESVDGDGSTELAEVMLATLAPPKK